MKTLYTETIEVPLALGGSVFEFNNEFNLQDATKIVAIEAYSADHMAKTPNGKNLANAGVVANSYLTLTMLGENTERIKNYPVRALVPALNAGIVREFDIPKIDPSKCKILVQTPTNIVNGEYMLFVFHYIK